MKERIQLILKNLRKGYRLSVTEKNTFTEVFSMPVSKLKFYLAVVSLFVFGFLFAVLLFIFTPVKKAIPGYPTSRTREMIIRNTLAIDSLEVELAKRDEFLAKIKAVISGEIIDDTLAYRSNETEKVELKPMHNDTIFNELITPEHYRISSASGNKDGAQIDRVSLNPPLFGLTTNRFDALPGHYGTDIVGRLNAPVASILDGMVVFAEWSLTTGYVVIVQHSNNLLSVYKHNSDILAKAGEKVKKGEIIALMGGEGEYSTGPHLHFEMWQNGVPLDPENYFNFRR